MRTFYQYLLGILVLMILVTGFIQTYYLWNREDPSQRRPPTIPPILPTISSIRTTSPPTITPTQPIHPWRRGLMGDELRNDPGQGCLVAELTGDVPYPAQ